MRIATLIFGILISTLAFSFSDSTDTVVKDSLETESVVDIAKAQLGTTYKWGGESKEGFDCSGFVKFCFAQIEIDLPHSSRNIGTMGKEVAIEEAEPGDIIVFSGTDGNLKRIGHVGIVTKSAEKELFFMHSSSSKKHYGVTETDYYNSGYPKRFIKIIRVTK